MKPAPVLLVLLSLALSAQAAFLPTGTMPDQFNGPAVPLADGRVFFPQESYVLGDKAAICDPATQTFFRTMGDLGWNQSGQTATLLADGRVLIAGGGFQPEGSRFRFGGTRLTIFDPTTETFAFAGGMNAVRSSHAAIRLRDGRVLIVGGQEVEGGGAGSTVKPTASAEIFDPVTGTVTLIAPMRAKRGTPSAALLPDGRVLIVGGAPSAEIFDPVSQTFSEAPPMITPRRTTLAVSLRNGDVLIAGGTLFDSPSPISAAEVFDVRANRFVAAGEMTAPRTGHDGVLLPSGRVLIAGRAETAELFDPSTRTFGSLGATLFNHYYAALALLPDGSVLIAGGFTPQAERYVPEQRRRLSR